jgi:cytochrome c oxidase assembly protein subunit 15
MTDSFNSVRPVPRWLHVSAVLAVASTFVLLILGQMVTSFRAGMADPVWPTEPWYLFSNYKLDFGYLVEHSHRIAGFFVGAGVILSTIFFWWTEQRSTARWAAFLGLSVMITGFFLFFVRMIAQRNLLPVEMHIPMGSVIVFAIGFMLLFGTAISGLIAGTRNALLQFLSSAALVAVMVQGLLGGFRVKLNELLGTDLAAVHGVFANVVLSLLVLLAVLTERQPSGNAKATETRSPNLGRWAVLLTALIFVQIVWGALVRHNPTALAQKLHFLTAFLAVVIAALLLRAVFACPTARGKIGLVGWVLIGLIALQLYLGVEAWMMKFGLYILPELVQPTPENAGIRTLHALIGSGILTSSLILLVRLQRTTGVETPKQNIIETTWTDPPPAEGRTVEIAARLQGNSP